METSYEEANSSPKKHFNLLQRLKNYVWSLDFVEVLICLAGVLIPYFLIKTKLETTQRPIPYQKVQSGDVVLNLTYDQLMTKSTFNNVALYLIAFGSFFVQLVLSLIKYKPGERHATICVYIVTLGITLIMTEIMKRYAGYLRPHFFSECNLDTNSLLCTGDTSDSRRSFPSGHASTTFCCLSLLTMYLLQKFGIHSCIYNVQYHSLDSQRSTALVAFGHQDVEASTDASHKVNSSHFIVSMKIKKSTIWIRIISVFCLSPMLLAYIVAGSRVVNNYHHPADVVGGAVLGTAIAIFINGIWFPSFDVL